MGNKTNKSKFLSLILRHQPELVGLKLDEHGWVNVSDLLAAVASKGITKEVLEDIVATDNKKRYKYSDDGLKIRASQGHSVNVDLGYKASTPPSVLYHGTDNKNYESIIKRGILKGSRTHVHLSADVTTAKTVGSRHGSSVWVITLNTKEMLDDGLEFFVSDNGVWLIDHVPVKYIKQ